MTKLPVIFFGVHNGASVLESLLYVYSGLYNTGENACHYLDAF